MKKKVTVFAPASIANLGCGFDVIGLALDEVGDVLEISASDGDGISIVNETNIPLPTDTELNVITPVVRKFLEMISEKAKIKVRIIRKISPGSGIGSSAASSAAAAFGMNQLYDCPLSEEDVVLCAMEGENLASGGYHADNAAPAVMGGIVLIRGYEPLDLIKLPVPGNFYCSVAHPHIMVSTKEARSILPREISLHDAVRQWGNVGGMVSGLYSGDMALVGRAMKDLVAEPYRKQFIPGFDDLRTRVMDAGALAMNIAGSGPSVFALADSYRTAVLTEKIMKEHFASTGCETYAIKITNRGARVL
ncbi:MAG: homoserine kinase [Bacteroidales bacterium]|nr:homoserine kinase [Bacteroidales bacterium]